MAIEFQNVSKHFGSKQALRNVTLRLEEGQIYGLLGNNGAGKSTLMKVLTGRLNPDGGQVLVDGIPVSQTAALSRLFLMGEENLFPASMKVKRAFKLAGQFYSDFDADYAGRLAGEFGLELNQKISKLSTGYGSIFRLILALSVNTPYVLLDEPVLGLDAEHRDLLYRTLIQKFSDRPCTMVISTHLIEEVAAIVGHTVIIRAGEIIRDAPTETLTGEAYTVSGPAGLMDAYLAGRQVMTQTELGGLKTACVRGEAPETVPAGLEVSSVRLQDYFVSLMREEERK